MNEEWNNERTGLEIAVIGMAGRFPGANTIDEFWENLKNGVESISFFSEEELEKSGFSLELITNPAYVKAKGIIENVRYFDASFFDYSNREAETLDPQTRIFHECIWETLENAGYDPHSYDGHIGLFAGANTNTYWENLCSVGIDANMSEQIAVSTLCYKDFLPSRVSYKLGLKGTTFFLYTACSTSLAAVHLACSSLLGGECDMALAGGISIILPEKFGYLYEDGMILSNDGHNRVFDDRATGSPFGDGVGTVLIKRLEDAVNDGDNILAAIKGSAINNDGNRKLGYTAPSVEGQVDVIRAAMYMAEVEPESIGYIETHGTATSLGDVVEMEALNMAFENLDLENGSCPIGSLKSNMGHLNTAAGIAGFIKTVLALKYKLIPPNLHFETANSRVDFANSPFYVNTRLHHWENGKYPRRAGISAFGIGGTNIHLILEEWPEDRRQTTEDGRQRTDEREYQLILMSAKTQSALDNMTKNLAEHFKKNHLNRDNHENPLNPGLTLADAAYTLQVGRRAFPYRRMTVCPGVNEAVHILSQEENDKQPAVVSRKLHTTFTPGKKKVVIFMFAGLGDQYVNMGRQLYEKESLFRREMDRCFELLKPLTDVDIKEILYPTHPAPSGHPSQEGNRGGSLCPPQGGVGSLGQGNHRESPLQPDRINQPEIAQLTVFIIEYALARLLMSWGIEPKAMIGYSFGEYAAACIAGVLSLEHALKLLVSRGRLISATLEGAMTSVPLPVEKLKPFMDERLAIAIDNGLTCIVAGATAAIEAFEEKMKGERLICLRLETRHAIHSPLMEPILAEFQQALNSNGIKLNKPRIPYISNITGEWITGEEAQDNGYWVRHLRETVRFSEGLNRLLKKEDAVFLEIGPGRALGTQLKQQEGKDSRALVTNCLKHPGEAMADEAYLLNKIGHLWLWGIEIDWGAYHNNKKRRRVPLPTYPFEGQCFWKEAAASPGINQAASTAPSKLADISKWFYRSSWKPCWIPEPDREPSPLQVLLFIDDCGQGLQLGQRLQKQGHHITFVKKGPGFSTTGEPDTYTIAPDQADHYDMLLKDLQEKQKVPQRIFHLWGVTGSRGGSMDIEAINDFLKPGFYSLLYLAKAIGNRNLLEEIQLLAITDHLQEVTGQEVLHPEKAVISAACKVISQEYSNITCRDIDIILPGTNQRERLIRQLSAELYIESTDTVVYRGNYRWTRVYEPILLPESITRFSRLKQGGVYLITGGLGGIGFVLARYLAQQYRAKLILTGRTVLPPREQWDRLLSTRSGEDPVNRKIRKLQELGALGAELLTFSVDAADEAGMRQAISVAEERFGPIDGVIHTAGHVERNTLSTISDINMSQARLHFQAKLYGLLVLSEIFANREKNLDFCLLMSSISSVLGGLGLAAYAAANSFMDAFVYRQNRQNHSRWISVNWDGWRTPDTPDHEGFSATAWEDFAMSPEEGIEAVQRILSMDDPIHVVHSTGDLPTRIKQWLSLESLRKTHCSSTNQNPSASYPRPTLSTPYMAPRNKLERMIADVWQKFLGLGQVGTDDNFFDLNATSLDIVRVNSILRDVLKEDIPVVTMFNYPTIGSLARFLCMQETGEAAPQEEMNREEVIVESQDRMRKMRNRHMRQING